MKISLPGRSYSASPQPAPVQEGQHAHRSTTQPAANEPPVTESRPYKRGFARATVHALRSWKNCGCISDRGLAPEGPIVPFSHVTPSEHSQPVGTEPSTGANNLHPARPLPDPSELTPYTRRKVEELRQLQAHLDRAARMGHRRPGPSAQGAGPSRTYSAVQPGETTASTSMSSQDQGPSHRRNAGHTPWGSPARMPSFTSPQAQGDSSASLYPASNTYTNEQAIGSSNRNYSSATSVFSRWRNQQQPAPTASIEMNAMRSPRAIGLREPRGLPTIPEWTPSQSHSALPPNREPTPMSVPIDWRHLKAQLMTGVPQNENLAARRARQRAAMRERLFGPSAQPVVPASSSLQAGQETQPVFLTISEENMHAEATGVLQRVIGTRPELANVVQQQEWVGLLNRTLHEFDALKEAHNRIARGDRAQKPLSILENEMRQSLRDLLSLSLSNEKDVFNFGRYMPPQSESDLDAFVSLPQFRMLVEAVNDVHEHLEQERSRLGPDVEFANSSRTTSMTV